jgi:hypothetical protein
VARPAPFTMADWLLILGAAALAALVVIIARR